MSKTKLAPNTVVVLPSGNAVRLLGCIFDDDGAREWFCEYRPGCKARGEVVFTVSWLEKFSRPSY